MRSHDRNGGQIADWVPQHYQPVKVGGDDISPVVRRLSG
jgi:hypothetical protein